MQRLENAQSLITVSTFVLLLALITLISLSYFHSNDSLFVYGRGIVITDTAINTNSDMLDRNTSNLIKLPDLSVNPTIGAIITDTNPTSGSHDDNTDIESTNGLNNDYTNNTATISSTDTNANVSSNYLPSSSQSQSINSAENMTGVQEGDGQEIDTGDEVNHVLTASEAQALKANLVVPDSSPFKSNQCTPVGSLEKFVPNPFMKDLGTTRFVVGNCITVTGKVTWTHYINTDGDANFNVKLDKKYNSLLTPANMNNKLKGTLHVEVVCQGKNSSKDPVKINQCKVPKYDGPDFNKALPKVGSRVQVTGIYVIDIREGGHAELHPAYQIQKVS